MRRIITALAVGVVAGMMLADVPSVQKVVVKSKKRIKDVVK